MPGTGAGQATIVRCERCGTKNRVPFAAPGSPKCGKCGAPLPWIAEADDETFAAVVETATMPVLLDPGAGRAGWS